MARSPAAPLAPRRRAAALAVVAALAAVLAGPAGAGAGERVLVMAAASARDAMEAAIAAFAPPAGARVEGVYAASPALARQIIDGAPAALFLSANTGWMDAAEEAGRVAERHDYLANRLVLVAPEDAPPPAPIADAAGIAPALAGGRLAVAETTAVPAGIYARRALENLGAWDGLRGRLAEAANVRGALFLVERGEAPLGLVYRTDALASKGVRALWTVPAEAHPPIVYPLALLAGAADSPAAAAFMAFLLSEDGRRVFAARGFGTD